MNNAMHMDFHDSPTSGYRSTGRAFTLVELLAVLVILGMVLVVSLGIARPMAAGHQRLAAEAAVGEALQRASAVARTRGQGVILTFGTVLALEFAGADATELSLSPTRLPAGWRAEVRGNLNETRDSLEFDRAGTSADAIIDLTGPGGAGEKLTIELLGLSGQTRRIDVSAIHGTRGAPSP